MDFFVTSIASIDRSHTAYIYLYIYICILELYNEATQRFKVDEIALLIYKYSVLYYIYDVDGLLDHIQFLACRF